MTYPGEPVNGPQFVIVGENGPELVVLNRRGTVIPDLSADEDDD